MSVIRYGNPSDLHHFATALSVTPYSSPISIKPFVRIKLFKMSREGFFFDFFSTSQHDLHMSAL